MLNFGHRVKQNQLLFKINSITVMLYLDLKRKTQYFGSNLSNQFTINSHYSNSLANVCKCSTRENIKHGLVKV